VKSKIAARLFAFLALAACLSAAGRQAPVKSLKPEDLPESYARWLEEEIAYIISPVERDVFLKLRSDRERDLFIEAFWKQRDPNPATEENEFRAEHYRRIGRANRLFGRVTPNPGWKTDRGRVLIILGEPNDIRRFEGQGRTQPAEIWFYQNQAEKGLPPGFQIVFFQPRGIGDFLLYNPVEDGPMALLASYGGDPADPLEAAERLSEAQPELAAASLSLIPGESASEHGRPSLASQSLLQKVETAGWKRVREKYALKFLEYKDLVEVEYSANHMDSDSLVRVFQAANGMMFVHYALEPERLSVAEHEGRFSATFRLNGTLTDEDGRLVFQFEKTLAPRFDLRRLNAIRNQPFIIHDMFPVVPGSYRLSILVKNEVSKEFTTLEHNLSVPDRRAGPRMTPLLLAYKTAPTAPTSSRLKPFQLAGRQLYVQANRVFVRSDTLGLAFQVLDLPEETKKGGEFVFTFLKDGRMFRTFSRPVASYVGAFEFLEPVSLEDFPPAHYTVTVGLDFQGRTIVSVSDVFDVTHSQAVPRPWVYAKVLPGPADSVHLFTVGSQLHYLGRFAEARTALERAVAARPDAWEYALILARTCTALRDFERVEELLEPFSGREGPAKIDILLVLAEALREAGRFDRAVEVLEAAVSRFGVNTFVLNALGECHLGRGREQEARAVWEKSLELNPDQPALRRSLEALKEKK